MYKFPYSDYIAFHVHMEKEKTSSQKKEKEKKCHKISKLRRVIV